MKGLVYLVGAGPGDPELITVKGLRVMEQADVIIYDRLVNSRLLKHARAEAEILYVGKSPQENAFSQEKINRLIAQKAKEGKMVVRLKGGDPFVFGRGGEEAEYLKSEQVPFEIVPGITSAIAAPAYAGIPVTHRDFSSSFAVITGTHKGSAWVDWRELAKSTETLVFLMGMKNLPFIIDQLIQNGREPTTPIALIQWGTTIEQKVVIGNLGNIEQKVSNSSFQSPVIIIIGQVVQLHEKLRWFEKKPLFGQRILITRGQEQSKELADKIMDLGGEPLELPVIRMVPPRKCQELDQALQRLDEYDWVIFTSVNGVKFFFERLKERKIDIRKMAKAKIAVVGPKTKEVIEEKGIIIDCIPREHVAESLIETLRSMVSSGERVLLPRSDIARNLLPLELKKMGCHVEAVDAYDTIVADEKTDEVVKKLQEGLIHVITFTSSSTVRNFRQIISEITDSWQDLIVNIKVVCIGPITAQTAQELGFTVDAVANPYTIDGLIKALQS